MIYKEVWGSSKQHQKELNNIVKQNSLIRKAIGIYKIPKDFPYVGILWNKFPIVYDQRFSLELINEKVTLTENNKFGFLNKAKNINKAINNNITISEIINISRYENPQPFIKYFNINWIELTYRNNDTTNEILLAVGGKLMSSVRKQTNILYQELQNRKHT